MITFLAYPFTSLGKIIGARIAYDAVQQQLADDPHLRIVFAAARSGLKPAIDGLQAIGLHPGMPIDTQELTQIVNSVVSLIQSEAFAQLTSLYYTAPEFTAKVLPRSHQFMQELTEAAHERNTAHRNRRIRAAFRVPGQHVQDSGDAGRGGNATPSSRSGQRQAESRRGKPADDSGRPYFNAARTEQQQPYGQDNVSPAQVRQVAGHAEENQGPGETHNRRAEGYFTVELIPTIKLPAGRALVEAGPALRKEFTDRGNAILHGANGENLVAEALGLRLTGETAGIGGYEQHTNPNRIIAFPPDAPVEKVRALGRIYQVVSPQDGVPYFIADMQADTAKPENALGVMLDFGRPLDDVETDRLFAALREAVDDDIGFTNMGEHGVAVVNFRGGDGTPFMLPDAEFTRRMAEFVDTKGGDMGLQEAALFGARGEYLYHPWEEDPDGKQLIDQIAEHVRATVAGRGGGTDRPQAVALRPSDILARIRGWRAAFDTLAEEFAEKAVAEKLTQEQRDTIIRFALSEHGPGLYSQLEQVVESKMGDREGAGILRAKVLAWAKAGDFKQEELGWSGLGQWLEGQTGKTAKGEVLDYLRANAVEISEVRKSDEVDADALISFMDQIVDEEMQSRGYDRVAESMEEWRNEQSDPFAAAMPPPHTRGSTPSEHAHEHHPLASPAHAGIDRWQEASGWRRPVHRS